MIAGHFSRYSITDRITSGSQQQQQQSDQLAVSSDQSTNIDDHSTAATLGSQSAASHSRDGVTSVQSDLQLSALRIVHYLSS